MPTALSDDEHQALAEFRHQIRRYLRFAEGAAREAGLLPQQYQALLALKGMPPEQPTIGDLADYLQIQPHSAVTLVDRLEERDLVRRQPGEEDRRKVFVILTPEGERMLRRLAAAHRAELQTIGPSLVRTLSRLIADAQTAE